MHGIPDGGSTDERAASPPPDWPEPGTPLPAEEPTIELPVVTEAMLAGAAPARSSPGEPASSSRSEPTSSPTLATAALSLATSRPARPWNRRGPRATAEAPAANSVALDDLLAHRDEPAGTEEPAGPPEPPGAPVQSAEMPEVHEAQWELPAEAEVREERPTEPGRGWLVGAGIAAAALLLTGATVLVLSRDDGPGGTGPAGWSPPVDAAPAAATAPHTATGALAGRTTARFDLIDGAKQVTVRAADLGDSLYQVTTPDDGAGVPRTEEQDGRIQLRLDGDAQSVDITLNAAVRWDLRFTGGAELSTIDLSAGRVDGVDLTGGASRIALTLPRPDGTLTVRMSGGVGLFDMRTAERTPVRVRVGRGAGQVTLDGENHAGVAAGRTFTPASWAEAEDRVDVDAAGGMSAMTVVPY